MNKLILTLALAAGATAATAATASAASAQTVTKCPASFHVVHDDRIGALPVAAGAYQLTTNGVSCAQATTLFAEFLSDYNGDLPKPWRYNGENTFTATPTGKTITFTRTGGADAATDLSCPGTFRVLHNDKIGPLSVPKGSYRVTLLGGNLSCDDANRLLARFLRDRDGKLGGGWTVLPDSGEFASGSSHNGFRIKPVR